MTMNVEILQIQYIDKVVEVPGVLQRQHPAIQKVQKTVEVPQVQLIDKVVDMLVVLQRQVSMIQKVQKTVEFHTCSTLTRSLMCQLCCNVKFPPWMDSDHA